MTAADALRRNVQRLMRRDDVTRSALAAKLGYTKTWATEFFKGKADTTMVVVDALARIFSVSPRELFDDRLTSPVTESGLPDEAMEVFAGMLRNKEVMALVTMVYAVMEDGPKAQRDRLRASITAIFNDAGDGEGGHEARRGL